LSKALAVLIIDVYGSNLEDGKVIKLLKKEGLTKILKRKSSLAHWTTGLPNKTFYKGNKCSTEVS
jgi:hypothetical protein